MRWEVVYMKRRTLRHTNTHTRRYTLKRNRISCSCFQFSFPYNCFASFLFRFFVLIWTKNSCTTTNNHFIFSTDYNEVLAGDRSNERIHARKTHTKMYITMQCGCDGFFECTNSDKFGWQAFNIICWLMITKITILKRKNIEKKKKKPEEK